MFVSGRIGILIDGRLRALGTTDELKRECSSGLRVDVTAHVDDIDSVHDFLMERFADNFVPVNDFGSTRHYSAYNVSVATLFSLLETKKSELKITDYVVSETTLETVFLHTVQEVASEVARVAERRAVRENETV
eukprot:TRINITY_DN970_c0_g2_i2.p2 TRINITY_DN970_c0_g2~~TRINITY_DN970_c0_g2_i2.p2  ORF type:complete len:134 (-),score=50.90 TRINITY_DN970_c0_g2_i2:119-520(-)